MINKDKFKSLKIRVDVSGIQRHNSKKDKKLNRHLSFSILSSTSLLSSQPLLSIDSGETPCN